MTEERFTPPRVRRDGVVAVLAAAAALAATTAGLAKAGRVATDRVAASIATCGPSVPPCVRWRR